MPRPETGPLAGRVVDATGRPVAGAVVNGQYASMEARHWFREVKADAQGRFASERSLDPLVLHARTADGTLAGVARSDAEATQAQVTVGPIATASGLLLDLQGNALAQKELPYGIRVYLGDPKKSPFSDHFGGKATTDADGRFTLAGLVPGETYSVSLRLDETSSRTVTTVKPAGPDPIDIGGVKVDPEPSRPYVPPTPEQRSTDAFAARAQTPARERIRDVLAEASREYTRPLLLFGCPKDPACIELFRLFAEDSAPAVEGERRAPSPSELRWEFELASLDAERTDVREFAAGLGVAEDQSPALVVLDADGSVAATHPLRLEDQKKLDVAALSAFLAAHKLATRDAEQMLADALRRATAEDKRVFFIASASWCGPCRRLSRFLSAHKEELGRHFVFVKLDISRDKHGDALRNKFKEARGSGVPWYAIRDGDGKALITSSVPGPSPSDESTNIGYPSDPAGITHFLKMLKETAPRLSEDRLAELRKAPEKGG